MAKSTRRKKSSMTPVRPTKAPAPKSGRGPKGPLSPPAAPRAKPGGPKRLSAINAAARVLANSGKPMRTKELITQMEAKGLWKSKGGKTPQSTLYAAIHREISDKGSAARFRKVDRGLFAHNATDPAATKPRAKGKSKL